MKPSHLVFALASLCPLAASAAPCDDGPQMATGVDAAAEAWAEGRGMALTPAAAGQVRTEFCAAAAEVAKRLSSTDAQIRARIPQVVGRYLEKQVGDPPYLGLDDELFNELGSLGPNRTLPRRFMALRVDARGTSPDRIRLGDRLLPAPVFVLVAPGAVDFDGLRDGRPVCRAHLDVAAPPAGPTTIPCDPIP